MKLTFPEIKHQLNKISETSKEQQQYLLLSPQSLLFLLLRSTLDADFIARECSRFLGTTEYPRFLGAIEYPTVRLFKFSQFRDDQVNSLLDLGWAANKPIEELNKLSIQMRFRMISNHKTTQQMLFGMSSQAALLQMLTIGDQSINKTNNLCNQHIIIKMWSIKSKI